MKKLAILILALATFSMAACPKVTQVRNEKNFYTVYELPNKKVYICDYESGCSDKHYIYFIFDTKKGKLVESQVKVSNSFKTYNSEDIIIHETFHDYRRQALRNALETERANCLLKN